MRFYFSFFFLEDPIIFKASPRIGCESIREMSVLEMVLGNFVILAHL